MKACARAGCRVTKGPTFTDIDEAKDLDSLYHRIVRTPALAQQCPEVAYVLQSSKL